MSKWPKRFPPLSPEEKAAAEDFMRHWHEVLPKKYGVLERFSHGYPVRTAPPGFQRTLEIGAGLGEHLAHERLDDAQRAGYHALELREVMAAEIRRRFPWAHVEVGDCQERLPYPDGHFDRIVAVHVLEHLPNLPAAVSEMRRVIDPARGVLSVVIPCEGSLAYTLARRISAQRIFEKRYRMGYRRIIEREHVNRPEEIAEELERGGFRVTHRAFFPFPVPLLFCNLVLGMTLKPV